MKRTIYISGKITGTTDFVERFARAESHLKLQGWRVINPVKKCRHMNPNATEWHHYMRRDICCSTGNNQARDQAGITELSWQLSSR